MTGSPAPAVRGRWRRGVRFLFRTGRRTLVETLYLLTAPVTATAGLLLMFSALCVGALAPVRWFADLERWRIAKVRPAATGMRRRTTEKPTAADPGLWLGLAHAVVVFPMALVTSLVTGLWWFVAVGSATTALRNHAMPAGPLPPMTLNVGNARSHVFLGVGLTSAPERIAVGTVAGLLALCALPLVTRMFVAVQAGLGRLLLSETSALHRRISGLERERDTARAQTAAAVSAEATALRRLERDIHDGPQQRLVRLAMDLGRAQHHFDSRPEAVREALAEAIVQAQETLDELRALSRGIAPPILVDRGLPAALADLATLSSVPVTLDADPLTRRPDAAVETAAYFVIAEAMTNVAKHSRASRCTVELRHGKGTLRARVTDDGIGGAALDKGHGLRGLADRLHAVGGRLRVTSPDGGPTTIAAELPCC